MWTTIAEREDNAMATRNPKYQKLDQNYDQDIYSVGIQGHPEINGVRSRVLLQVWQDD